MAVQGEDINRASTPMKLLEENLAETSENARRKKKAMETDQKMKSPFLIGSIDEINERISKLDRKLQKYHQLVVESRMSEAEPPSMHLRPPSAQGREMYQQREKEAREVNQFAGVFAIKSTFVPGLSDRVKNISKITMAPSKNNVAKDSGKPKFVELHQFPGYDSKELTALPNQTTALSVLTKVAEAQPRLSKKPQYRPEFERLFYSQMSQAILQDMFWWYFLERYQASKQSQVKLFNRVSHNYVKLLMFIRSPQYRDAFLKEYPNLLSQAIYTGFCDSFPDSYRQFNANFREELIFLVYDWVAGLRPAPRSWMTWNLDRLEPTTARVHEEIMSQSKASGKGSLLNFDFLESTTHGTSSQSTLQPFGSQSSLCSSPAKHNSRPVGGSRHKHNSHSAVSNTSIAIAEVAGAQEATHRSSMKISKPLRRRHSVLDATPGVERSRGAESKGELQEPLTPIHEEEAATLDPQDSKTSVTKSLSTMQNTSMRKPQKDSHPVGRGPDFVRSVFNIYGQSPLLAHFMRMQHLEPESGLKVRLQRTELENMPALDAPTYRDLVQSGFKHVHNFHKNYLVMMDRNLRSGAHFIQGQKHDLQEHQRRQNALLSKPREVKRLSELLMLELKKDQDSIGTGATAAVQAALMAQE